MAEDIRTRLKKQQYGLIGKHTAVKICTWTKKSITNNDVCYKQKFYGINSHLCCQMTPSLNYCQNSCIFCWRTFSDTEGFNQMPKEVTDDPKEIIDKCISAQIKLLSGMGGNKKTDMEKFKESKNPIHFAISLSGEPTLYPYLSELIKELHKRKKTTFLVSNGLAPEVLETIEPPTQLYISIDAPNEELFKKIDVPKLKDGWQRLKKTLGILKNIKTRTVLRITLIKGINDVSPKQYANLITLSDADFVEVKAYMFVGASRQRLSLSNMPRHPEVMEFAKEITKYCDYSVIDEKKESRVVLLGSNKKKTKQKIDLKNIK
ncbi:MAG TPA: 4-demethylwyosine synthase TYW1 [Candidatus Woesearchaeota archaeon]|nr:4-demethylwyosine synthase TYW1 [Candidatus Woesearchaeota archaeon]